MLLTLLMIYLPSFHTVLCLDCIFALGCSNKFIYENAVKCDKSSFEAFADSSETNCRYEALET